jgi:low temperature requirement protein LtrA
VSVDPDLLAERLGLFVIIVLGESVVEIVDAASETQFNLGLLVAGIASFVLLGALATGVSGRTLVIYLALVVLAHLWFERRLAPIQGPVESAAQR